MSENLQSANCNLQSPVYLVGAGPGDPGLLTLRAVECLQHADVVIHDRLVPRSVLDHAPAGAQRICVTDLAELHGERGEPVQDLMIEAARQGRRVVRLKGGDPFVFGRGGEEALALRQAGIAFEVVPGVSAALAAAAFAGIPLTHRGLSSAVALVTGHEQAGLDWAALARFPGTLVVYMGMGRLGTIVQTLIELGGDPAMPAVVVQRASTGQQRTVEAPLARLPQVVREAGLTAPAVVVIGAVAALRSQLAWFEQRPLFGRRVLVTRPRHQAGDFVRRLELLGAVPLVLPAVEIRPPADWSPVDRALANLASYQWLVFTSANGVQAFLGRLRSLGQDWRTLAQVRIAAIGAKTAETLRSFYLEPDLVPTRFQSEDLAAVLKEKIVPGQRVLLARADRGRELLREELAQVAEVEQVAVYSQIDAVHWDSQLLDLLRRGEIDFITLTSANIARALLQSLDEPCRQQLHSGQGRLVSISPVTSAAIKQLGFPIAAEAQEATMDGILQALVKLAGEKP